MSIPQPTDREKKAQKTVSIEELRVVPPTVRAHTRKRDGLILHTIAKGLESDIRVYDDERPAHLVRNNE